jgi:hypothetical protein
MTDEETFTLLQTLMGGRIPFSDWKSHGDMLWVEDPWAYPIVHMVKSTNRWYLMLSTPNNLQYQVGSYKQLQKLADVFLSGGPFLQDKELVCLLREISGRVCYLSDWKYEDLFSIYKRNSPTGYAMARTELLSNNIFMGSVGTPEYGGVIGHSQFTNGSNLYLLKQEIDKYIASLPLIRTTKS